MNTTMLRVMAAVLVASAVFSTATQADEGRAAWYAGAALHGLHADAEHDGDLVTDLEFLGPRLYGGRRINDYLGVEVEAGRAIFDAELWSGRLEPRLRMWNMAVTALLHSPWKLGPVEPFAYGGVGQSIWNYKVESTSQGGYTVKDSGSDLYWHVGGGAQIVITTHLTARIGYRYWRSNMQPRHYSEGGWAVNPDDYYYKRQGLEVGAHWRF